MELSLQDALDIFRGWKDETSPVTFFLDGTEALVRIRGVVAGIVEDEIVVSTETSRIRLDLKNAEFEYQDPREAPEFLRQAAESDFLCCVEVCLPTDSRCFLFELPPGSLTHSRRTA
jgi:hypothetical protein